MQDLLLAIQKSLSAFATKGNLKKQATAFWNTLGYQSQKTNDGLSWAMLKGQIGSPTQAEQEAMAYAQEACMLFQLTDSELSTKIDIFATPDFNQQIYQSYVFMAIRLDDKEYKRDTLATLTRLINKPFAMPVIVLFCYAGKASIAIVHRRVNKKDERRDVLEKVTILKDIDALVSKRSQLEILADLYLDIQAHKIAIERGKTPVGNFLDLHHAWQNILSISQLNEKFYKEIRNWYLWATNHQHLKFPQIRLSESEKIDEPNHKRESVIRLLTRFLFCWFLKEKGIVGEQIFNPQKLGNILQDFNPQDTEKGNFYHAIVQNLFFATLNVKVSERRYTKSFQGISKDYGNPHRYRYAHLFQDEQAIQTLFGNVPFLNGGLFECLDTTYKQDESLQAGEEIRLDGFSEKAGKQAIVPNVLFFGKDVIDLTADLDPEANGGESLKRVQVQGLIEILDSYKFTVEENTPFEQDVALDPELLGRMFEELLAYYVPETKTTLRKSSGSFYTPREVVDYMIEQSLLGYLRKTFPALQTWQDVYSLPANKIIEELEKMRILDPACGSGAFPMGVLYKIQTLLKHIDPQNKLWFESLIKSFPHELRDTMRAKFAKEDLNYVRKLGIIRKSIYGVDKQPVAIQITKLRCFLSLIIEQKLTTQNPDDNFGIKPLPNLEFKFVAANTLLHVPNFFPKYQEPEEMKELKVEFVENTQKYFSTEDNKDKRIIKNAIKNTILSIEAQQQKYINSNLKQAQKEINQATAKRKKELENRIKELEKVTEKWKSFANIFKEQTIDFFAVEYVFPEAQAGFDVVIGNPPYVRADNPDIADLRAEMMASGEYETLWEKWDLYVAFIERGYKLLAPRGILSYIIPDAFATSKYAEKAHNHYVRKAIVNRVNFLMDIKIFKAGIRNIIIELQNGQDERHVPLRINHTENFANQTILPTQEQAKLLEKVFKKVSNNIFEPTIEHELLENIVYMSVGMVTNANENDNKGAFVKDDLISDKKDDIHSKMYVEGKDIKAYKIENIKYIEWNTPRVPNGLRRPTFRGLYEGEKILRGRVTLGTIDNTGIVCNDSIIVMKRYTDLSDLDERSIATTIAKNNLSEGDRQKTGEQKKQAVRNRRQELETISEDYTLKYILAVINSKYAMAFLNNYRRHRLENYFYPDDFRNFPIPKISPEAQTPFVRMVDLVMWLKAHEAVLETPIDKGMASYFEWVIDAMVYELYFEEALKQAGKDILQFLQNLPTLPTGAGEAEILGIIRQLYTEIYEPNTPVRKRVYYIDSVPEVRMVEGKEVH